MKTSRSLCAALFCLATFNAHALPSVGFDQDTLSVDLGDTFELVLQGSGFDFTSESKLIDNVTGGQFFDLSYGASVLQLVDVQIASRWIFTSGNKTGVIDNGAGTLTGLAFGTFPATTDDSFEIATLRFQAIASGPTDVRVTDGALAARVAGISGSSITPSFDSASVTVASPVPEPETWPMLIAGLAMLGWRARRASA